MRPAQGRRLGVSTALASVHLQAATTTTVTATTIPTRCYEEVRRTFTLSSPVEGTRTQGRGRGRGEECSLASPDGSSRAGANPWPEGVVTMATFTRFGEECEAKHAWVWVCALCGPRGKALLSPSIDSACLIMLLLLLLPSCLATGGFSAHFLVLFVCRASSPGSTMPRCLLGVLDSSS